MDLERRVKNLEQEVEILKNQIQSTLLDIQEKVLTNTYSSLRAEGMNTPPDDDGGGGGKGFRQNGYQHVSASPNSGFDGQNDDRDSFDQPLNSQNRVQKVVSLESLGGIPKKSQPQPAKQPAQPEQVDWKKLEELEEWTINKIAKIGAKRTYKLLHTYAEQGRIDTYTLNALSELVKLYAKPKSGNSAQKESRSSNSAPRPAQNRSTNNQQERMARVRAQQQQNADGADENKNLILRLIAGVSNASIGISKGNKKYG